MTPKGHGLMLYAQTSAPPKTQIILRCALCSGWQKQTTEARREADFAMHKAGARHNGRGKRYPTRRLRLLQDATGRWVL